MYMMSIGEKLLKNMEIDISKLPSALLCAFVFFSNYYNTNGELLWKNDFTWCSDIDSNDDQIYVGRYIDVKGLNKNGFNIHRHLKIKNNCSCIDTINY